MTIGELIAQFLPKLISAIFNFLMTVMITAVQVISWPVNQVLSTSFPSLSEQITSTVTNLNQLLAFLPYGLSFFPQAVTILLIFILGTEITLMYVFRSTYFVSKLWKIVQTVKFW